MLDVCRLCGDQQPIYFNIFGSEGETRNLQSKMKNYLGLEVTLEDLLPKVVCNVCCERLEFYTKFCAKCHATQEKLTRSYTSVKKSTNETRCRKEPSCASFTKVLKSTPSSLSFEGLIDKIAIVKPSRISLSPMKFSAGPSQSVSVLKNNSSINNSSSTATAIATVINVDCKNESLNTANSGSSIQSKILPRKCGLQIPTYVSIKDNELVSFVPVKIKGTGDQLSCQVAIPRFNSQKSSKVVSRVVTNGLVKNFISQAVETASSSSEQQKPDGILNKLPKRKLIRLPASRRVTANVEKVSNSAHRCKLCGATFKHNFLCEYHVRSHIGEETFMCNICSKRFVARYMLVKHQRSHEEGFPYVCKTCRRGFRTSFSLKTHEKTHLDEPAPFKCDICQREFYFRTSFVGHMNTHDGERQRIACTSCKKTYSSKRHLKEHVERVHNRVKRHFCSTCNKGFYRNSTLKLHERLHTTERPHCCEDCGHSFNEKINLERHKKVHAKKNAILTQAKTIL